MSTTRTGTGRSISHRSVRAAAAAALVCATFGAGSGAAFADGSSDQQDAYVTSLLAKHDVTVPYTQMADYVSTLVFWHEHPDWNPAS